MSKNETALEFCYPFKNHTAHIRKILLGCFLVLAIPALAQNSGDSTRNAGDTSGHPQDLVHKTDSLMDPHNVRPHVYKMNYWISGGYAVLATAGNLYAIPNILHAKMPITDAELAGLNPDVFNSIDRTALQQDPSRRSSYQSLGDKLLPAFIVSAGVLGFDKRVRKDWLRILLMYYETHAVVFTLYNFSPFGPNYQNKYRPVTYYTNVSIEERKAEGNRNSLFSGHTANTAAATFFMAKVYTDYHPELGNKKYWFYAAACVPPIIEGYVRFKALEHFPSDIMEGFVIGAVTGIVIPSLHKVHTRNVQVGVTNTFTGPGLGLIWKPAKKEWRKMDDFRGQVKS